MTFSETDHAAGLWRAIAILAVMAACLALLYLSFKVAPHYGAIFDQLQMRDRLPMPTVMWLWLAETVRAWWWVLATVVVGLDIALVSGRLDRQARPIAIAALLAVGFAGVGWFSLRLPIAEIEQKLRG